MKVQTVSAMAGAAFTVQAMCGAAMATVDRRALTILLYDYAALPEGAVRSLEERTGRIMSRVGILVEWVQCGGPRTSRRPAPCSAGLKPGCVVLRILARCPEGDSQRGDLLGFAVTPGGYISLFADQVLRIEKDNWLDRGSVMPYAAAHEIGHLLLGPAHSSQGIMRAVWGEAELAAMQRLRLNFSEAEAEGIRRAVSSTAGPIRARR